MKQISLYLVLTFFFANAVYVSSLGLRVPRYNIKLKYHPEYDFLNIKSYLRNENVIRFQFKCIFGLGFCDLVGKWAKPRVFKALLGECPYCTETQKGWVNIWMETVRNKYPHLYRAAMQMFLKMNGIPISPDEENQLEKTLFGKYDYRFTSS